MPVSSVPSLLLGLSVRIFIDNFVSPREPSMREFGLLGLWQGVAVYYAFTISHELAAVAAFFISVKLLLEFNSEQDTVKFVTTVLGAVLGVFGTDLLSRYLSDGLYQKRKSSKSHTAHRDGGTVVEKKHRSVHFNKTAAGEGARAGDPTLQRRRSSRITPSDITSIDASSDMIRPHAAAAMMSPQEREVARLRTRASLADTERRRYKEERKWALSQGNRALAAQMTWEVKRYKALMQSFHKEADALVIQASNSGQNGANGQHHPAPDRNSRPNGTDVTGERHPQIATNGAASSHKRRKPGTAAAKLAVRTRW